MNRYNDNINEEDWVEGNIDNRQHTVDILVDVNGVNSVNNTKNTKIGRVMIDRADIEYCGTRRASHRELGEVGCVDQSDTNGIKETGMDGEPDGMERRMGGYTDVGVIEAALGRLRSYEGWVRLEENNMEKKTGKWERLLLRSNLGRRWMERIKEMGCNTEAYWGLCE
jgi:hypothetical protein